MKTALGNFDFGGLLKKAGMGGHHTPQELRAAALAMDIQHLTFSGFHRILAEFAASISADSASPVDSAAKLFAGLIHEIEFRRDMLNIPECSPAQE